MTRRFVEAVHVGAVGGQPVAFRWRDTSYVVRDVLGHWRERNAWWATPAARALLTGGTSPSAGGSGAGMPGAAMSGTRMPGTSGPIRVPGQRTDWRSALAEEFEVWRVEASRAGGEVIGVYDLCHDTGIAPDVGAWRLLRVVD